MSSSPIEESINWLEKALFLGTLEMDVSANTRITSEDVREILKIPKITFASLTDKENLEFHNACKRTLAISKFTNNGNEVAITYSLTATAPDKYKTVLGNETMTALGLDQETSSLLNECESIAADNDAAKNDNLIIVNIHNHPDPSFFSISDLLFFAEHPSIKIMALINNRSEIGFLYRPQYEKYKCVINNLLASEPNYYQKYLDFLHQTSRIPSVADIIPQRDLRQNIYTASLQQLKTAGIIIQGFVDHDLYPLIAPTTAARNTKVTITPTPSANMNLERDYMNIYEEGELR